MFIVINNTLFIVFQEPTDTCSNVHDKRNSHFRGFLGLPLQDVQYMLFTYMFALVFFPLSHVTSREISRCIPAAREVLRYFPQSCMTFKGTS